MDLAEGFAAGMRKGNIPQYLFRYRNINNYELDALKNNYLWFSNWNSYNDPFDGQVSIEPSYSYKEIFTFLWKLNEKRGFPKSMNEIASKAAETTHGKWNFQDILGYMLDEFNKTVKVCSFSKGNDNILMWAHYADSHKGICLEFDCTEDPLVFFLPITMQYKEKYVQFNFLADQSELIKSLVGQKYQAWEYENEHRIFKYPLTDNKVYYKPNALKNVIFGCKATQETIAQVKSSLRENTGVTFKKCSLSNSEYKLYIQDL